MQTLIIEELIWTLYRERVKDAEHIWLTSQIAKEAGPKTCSSGNPWHLVPLSLRPASCR